MRSRRIQMRKRGLRKSRKKHVSLGERPSDALAGRDQSAELVVFRRGGSWETRRERLQILEPCARVVDHDSFFRFQESVGEKLAKGRDAGTAFRRCKDAFVCAELQ